MRVYQYKQRISPKEDVNGPLYSWVTREELAKDVDEKEILIAEAIASPQFPADCGDGHQIFVKHEPDKETKELFPL